MDLCLQLKFLGMDSEAEEELHTLCRDIQLPVEYRSVPELLERLFEQRTEPSQISDLLEMFADHKIRQWHIQALWERFNLDGTDVDFLNVGLIYRFDWPFR